MNTSSNKSVLQITPRVALRVTFAMLGIVVIPAALALHSVRVSSLAANVPYDGSPHGYTISLLLFLVPSAAILFWFLPQERVHVSKRALLWTLGLLFPLGAALDFFFAHLFFVFPNKIATIGITAPALGGGVPLEEYVFYFSGFLTVVLLYVWFDEYWLAAYSVPDDDANKIGFDKLLTFHPASLVLAVLLIVAAQMYVKFVVAKPGYFPGYFIFLVAVSLLPSTMLLPSARPVVNWRALSLTMFIVLLTSLLWEATLALPYGWWNFRAEQMLGIRIVAWANLPVEEIYVWTGTTYTSVIVYEVVKRWKTSGKTMREAFLGSSR